MTAGAEVVVVGVSVGSPVWTDVMVIVTLPPPSAEDVISVTNVLVGRADVDVVVGVSVSLVNDGEVEVVLVGVLVLVGGEVEVVVGDVEVVVGVVVDVSEVGVDVVVVVGEVVADVVVRVSVGDVVVCELMVVSTELGLVGVSDVSVALVELEEEAMVMPCASLGPVNCLKIACR